MDTENQENFYCEYDGEYGVYCNICDKLCIERFYENQLKSQTQTNNTHKEQQLKDFKWSCYINMYWHCESCDNMMIAELKNKYLESNFDNTFVNSIIRR